MNYSPYCKNIYKIGLIFFIASSTLLFNLGEAKDFWLPSPIVRGTDGSYSFDFKGPVETGKDNSFGYFSISDSSMTNYKRIYSLDEDFKDFYNSENQELPKNYVSKKGYRTIRQWTAPLSFGFKLIGLNVWEGIGVSFGPQVKAEVVYNVSKKHKTLEKAKEFFHLFQLPSNQKDLITVWEPGDTLVYQANLTLALNAELKTGIIDTGIYAGFISLWRVKIQRPLESNPDQPIVSLTYTKLEGKKKGVEFKVLTSGLGFNKIVGHEHSIGYQFDLNSQYIQKNIEIINESNTKKKSATLNEPVTVLQAYQTALKGNLILADLFSKVKNSGVKKIIIQDSDSTSKQKTATYLNIPLLFNFGKTNEQRFLASKTTLIDNDINIESQLSVYRKDYFSKGVLSKKYQRSFIFTGNVQQISNLQGLDQAVIKKI
jgi:hypothetical protein